MVQARSAERRWSRALQYEHSLRLQLQDNMEALASQMHSLENEASQSMRRSLPSRVSKLVIPPSSNNMTETSSTLGKSTASTALAVDLSGEQESQPQEQVDGNPLSSGEEEDTFFDATDILDKPQNNESDMELSRGAGSEADSGGRVGVGHRRSVSSTSVNDAFSMSNGVGKVEATQKVGKEGPLISSDLRMEVSQFNNGLRIATLIAVLIFRFQLALVPVSPNIFLP